MSANNQIPTADPSVPSWPFPFVRGLILVAIAISSYLLWVSLTGSSVAGCGPESNCHRVLTSRWAYWFGIPVSALALAVYAAMFAATFAGGIDQPAARRETASALLACLSIVVAGAAVWFLGLQFFVIKSICPFCLAAHSCGLIASALILFHATVQHDSEKSTLPKLVNCFGSSRSRRLFLAALAGLAVLIGGQIAYAPQTYVVTSLNGGAATNSSLPAQPSIALQTQTRVEPPPKPERVFQIHDGKFQLDLYALPLIGSPEAPRVIVSLFDYTCHHCRIMHGHLMQAYQAFSNQLAIVSLPMPLDANCNRLMTRTPPPHVNACEYARIGLAVWRVDRKLSGRFESWIFELPSIPPLAEVRQFAEQLVGKEALERALADDWIVEQIKRDVTIYETHHQKSHRGEMPQLIIGSRVTFGVFNRVDELFQLLEVEYGLKAAR